MAVGCCVIHTRTTVLILHIEINIWHHVDNKILMTFNCVAVVSRAKLYGWALIGCTVILGIALIGLFVVHAQLDTVIDLADYSITDRDAFEVGHRRYKQLTTIQWLACLAYLPMTVLAWRRIDKASN